MSVRHENVFLLILSATINPAKGVAVARSDPKLRRADYFDSFQYWLNHPDPRLQRILLAENSDADLSEFRRSAKASSKEVEIIQEPLSPPPDMHYGYSELEMIDQALSRSRLWPATTHVIKATGRLIFPDLPKLLDRLPDDFRLAVDARAPLPLRRSEGGFVSVQLFLAAKDFYNAMLRKTYLSLAPAHHYPHFVEHLFFEKLVAKRGEKGVFLRFPVNCEPVGISGFTGQNYRALSRSLVSKVRGVCRVIAPDFWV